MKNNSRLAKNAIFLCMCSASFPALAQGSAAPANNFTITAGVTTRYDSNLARIDAATAAANGTRREDYRVSPSIGINLARALGRHSVSLAASAGYDFYRYRTNLNRERLSLQGKAALDIRPCTPDFSVGYSRRQSDLGEIDAISALPTGNTIKNVETVRSAGAQISCGAIVGLRPTASVQYQKSSNNQLQRRIANHHVLSYSGGVSYTHPTIGDIGLSVGRRETRYPNRPTGGTGGYDVMSYGVNFSRDIGSRLRGSAQLGYVDLKSNTVGSADFHGVSWSLDMTGTINSRWQASVSTARSVSSTLTSDSTYNVNKTYAIDTNYAITDRLHATAGYRTSQRRYVGSQSIFGIVPLRNDRLEAINAGLSFQQSPRLSFNLNVGRDSRNGNGTIYDYKSNRVMLGASLNL